MPVWELLTEEITYERLEREAVVQDAISGPEQYLLEEIRSGAGQTALETLVFFTPPGAFDSILRALFGEIRQEWEAGDEEYQGGCIRFLADLSLALASFLPRWSLQNGDMHGEAALSDAQVRAGAEEARALAGELAAGAPAATAWLLAEWRSAAAARLKAEQAPDPEQEAAALVGGSVEEYLARMTAELSRSHLRRVCELRRDGQTLTEISNDYAAFLPYALYLGASFVTCNPPLVDMAWAADPERWNPVVDRLIAGHPGAGDDELARLVTMEVVLDNMRLLRPIFLLTAGRMGCVCLQVNPHQHADAEAMVTAALSIYQKMKDRLDGGVPNVVFKLPGTAAGLQACRVLVGHGIGTTITVNFGMFQHLPFAEAIQQGQAIFGCLVEMSGRLAYPVRDELLSKLDELRTYGIDEARAREAAAWAGVAVVKRLYRLLQDRGYDLCRVKPLIASLRIYTGPGYQHLPGAFPDITEVLGASIISVFPNIRRPFDRQPVVELDPQRIARPVPGDILDVLAHSEIFKQAYYVADRDWLAEEEARFRPERELTLDDVAGAAAWPPVHNTLREFCNSYDTFVGRISERKRVVEQRRSG
jgi:transaldolase